MYRPEHEKLEVYGRAVAAAKELEEFAKLIPSYRHDLSEQLRRASSSFVLNLAEGANEFSANDKAKFYRIARRSAGECLAILDLAEPLVASPMAASAKTQLLPVMETLDKLAHAVLRRRR